MNPMPARLHPIAFMHLNSLLAPTAYLLSASLPSSNNLIAILLRLIVFINVLSGSKARLITSLFAKMLKRGALGLLQLQLVLFFLFDGGVIDLGSDGRFTSFSLIFDKIYGEWRENSFIYIHLGCSRTSRSACAQSILNWIILTLTQHISVLDSVMRLSDPYSVLSR